MELITEIIIIFIAAGILAYVARLLDQPLLAAYIGAGLFISFLGISNGSIAEIADLGIAFLLFIVGLEIEIKKLKDVGTISTFGGIFLSAILFGIGFLTGKAFGLEGIQALYIGLFLMFSSTMVVIKILSDRGELDTLHGRIVLGILLIQDILAIIALFTLSAFTGFEWITLIKTLALLFGIISLTYIANKYIYPDLFKFAAKSEELLFVLSIAICLFYIGIFQYLELSIAIGAFIAGVTLANLPYNVEIISLIKPLRDFFAVIFFVALGIQIKIGSLGSLAGLMIILFLLTMLLKPILTMFISSYFGYKKKPSFMTSLSLGQASEFGLIVCTLGLSLGHINQQLFSGIVLVTLISMAATSYIFEYEDKIYSKLAKHLDIFEKFTERNQLEYIPRKIKRDIILCGYNRLGYNIFKTLKKQKKKFLVVDYNPEVIRDLVDKKIPCIYGDVGDIEILHRLDFNNTKMIISTVPDKKDSLLLIRKSKESNPKLIMMVTALHVEDALDLYNAGADYVILPYHLGGEHMSWFLEDIKDDIHKVTGHKSKHIKELKRSHRLGKRHPENRTHHMNNRGSIKISKDKK